MNKTKPAVAVIAVLAIAAALAWWLLAAKPAPNSITLYGNVDLRQISLAFNSSERVLKMLVAEGDQVKAKQVLATLDTTLLTLRLARAQAQANVQQQALQSLEAGSRPEEIAQARAETAAAQARADQTRQQYQRLRDVTAHTNGQAVSREQLDAARADQAVALAQLNRAGKALELAIAGPRQEAIGQARAQLAAAQADLALLQQQLADAQLKAPTDAIVRSRLLEPGDMASPQRPAYTLALVSPKWIRAYIPETELGNVKPGQAAQVFTDSHPEKALPGRVGYISSVAEFTPKTVQTADLRTSLVYEIRINVDDPNNRLRLGMPATVSLSAPDKDQANGIVSSTPGSTPP